MDVICTACGEANPAGNEFCAHCNAFLAWDGTTPRTPAAGPRAGSQPVTAVGVPAAPGVEAAPRQADPGPDWAPDLADTVVPDAATTLPQGSVDQLVAVTGEGCPTCGRVNDPALRFCSRCGYGFPSSIPVAPSSQSDAWWYQSAAARDRAARRAYRQSLPPLYRWRRVLIALVVAALLVGSAVALQQSPVRVAKDGWYALNKRFVTVTPVLAAVDPADATAAGSDPARLVDGSVQEWTMNWQPAAESSCGAAAGTATIVLTFAPTRIRRLQIVSGLDKSNPGRVLQPLPKGIGITYPDGVCHPATLTTSDKGTVITLDSRTEVTSVRIGVGSVHRSGADDAPLVSFTEIKLLAYPS